MGRGVCPGPRLNNTLELVGLTALVLSLILFLVLRILALGLLLAILIADLHLILILVLHPAHLAFAGDSVTALAGFIRKFFAMNTTTSEAGGCHCAGIALCSSRTRATRNTVCQLREDCYLPPVNGPLDGILNCSPISSSFSWFLTYSAIRLSFFPTVST